MLRDWVLMALPSLARRQPTAHSAWCLSCFFVSAAAHAPWLQALFPQLQRRFGWFVEPEDRRLFCLAAREFYRGLDQEEQRVKFRETFEAAPAEAPYKELLQML